MKTPALCVVPESPVGLCQADPGIRKKQPGLWGRHNSQFNQSSAECNMDISVPCLVWQTFTLCMASAQHPITLPICRESLTVSVLVGSRKQSSPTDTEEAR